MCVLGASSSRREALVAVEFSGTSFVFDPKGVGSATGGQAVSVEVDAKLILANFDLKEDRVWLDVGALVAFTLLALGATWLVLERRRQSRSQRRYILEGAFPH